MKLHSLMRVFDGMPVKITAKRSYDMATAIRIAEEFGLHYTLEDCTESWLIPDLLKSTMFHVSSVPPTDQRAVKTGTVIRSSDLFWRNTASHLHHPPLIQK